MDNYCCRKYCLIILDSCNLLSYKGFSYIFLNRITVKKTDLKAQFFSFFPLSCSDFLCKFLICQIVKMRLLKER